MKSRLFFGLFFLLLFYILLRILNEKKLFFGLHFATDVTAVERPIPFFLILFRLKLKINIEPLFILLDRKHYKYVRLGMIVDILYLVQLNRLETTRLFHSIINSQLIGLQYNQTLIQFVNHYLHISLRYLVFQCRSGQHFSEILYHCVLVYIL